MRQQEKKIDVRETPNIVTIRLYGLHTNARLLLGLLRSCSRRAALVIVRRDKDKGPWRNHKLRLYFTSPRQCKIS
jgi:hypothetical protein